ncbi:hypothetical protein WOLCODRAFT_154041 [Wolfiporia cocos MD-104 SS10]|uniref:Uncharacterized protein n=1 Tax=Wolfiporia cocos (strain MD-104) TaxID=742152 RepID=A0A2H3K6C5_WOLCO|nr:hypothetical protein WOLCODRAFT_154041 [Wolfiporia cocos MD-104 SS10]
MWIPNLRLGVIATYILNTLIYWAGKREEELTLVKSSALYCCADEDPTHGDDDDDDDDDEDFEDEVDELEHYVPIGDWQGLYFLAGIVEDQRTYRLSKVRESELPPSHLLWLYRVSSTEDLATVFGVATGFSRQPRLGNPTRTNNRRPATTDIEHLRRDEPPVLNMGLDLRFWQTMVPMTLDGVEVARDVVLPRHAEVEEVRELDKQVSKIWFQMLSDIVDQSPNRRGWSNPSYVTLSKRKRRHVEAKHFQTFALPFTHVVWKVTQRAMNWENRVFERFFPPKGYQVPANSQNWQSCLYLQRYQRLMMWLEPGHGAEQIRMALRERFSMLWWMPNASEERMWKARKQQTMTTQHILPEDHTGGGVWILLNSQYFNPARFVVMLLPCSVDLESSDEDERRGCGHGRGRNHGREDENEDEEEDEEERGMEVA